MQVLLYLFVSILPLQAANRELEVRGKYSNHDYAYSVSIPEGLSGFRAAAPAPNHGFGIPLSKEPKSYLWVDASYNSAFWESFDDAINAYMSYIRDDRGRDVTLMRKEVTNISTLRAIRFVIHYIANESNERMVEEIILAFREDPGGVGVVYTIGLDASESRYKRDRDVLVAIKRGWEMKRLP